MRTSLPWAPIVLASTLDTDPPASPNLSLNICQITSLALSASSLLLDQPSWCPAPQPPLTSGVTGDEESVDKE